MATKRQAKRFTVQVVARVWTTVSVQANSFEEAVGQANELKIADAVDILGEHNDSEFEVVGIDKADWSLS